VGARHERGNGFLGSNNQTWDLVQMPTGKRSFQNKWVYKLKEEDGGEKRYKARLVVKGFAQKKGIDFDEIFSPCC
jgi:hypothetical protein